MLGQRDWKVWSKQKKDIRHTAKSAMSTQSLLVLDLQAGVGSVAAERDNATVVVVVVVIVVVVVVVIEMSIVTRLWILYS